MQNVIIRSIERLDFRTKEAYKTLRTNLSFAGKNVKVISLTSCTPNEGKTSVSFQLCLSLAESGKKTILVDADLRKSVLRGRYKANREKYGLSHYLSGQMELDDVCCRTNVNNFDIIACTVVIKRVHLADIEVKFFQSIGNFLCCEFTGSFTFFEK